MLRFLPQFGTDPFEVMTGPQLVKIAPRLAAFGGVVSGVIQRKFATQPEQYVPDQTAMSDYGQRAMGQGEFEGHDPGRIKTPAGAKVVSLGSMLLQNGDLIERKVVGRDGD